MAPARRARRREASHDRPAVDRAREDQRAAEEAKIAVVEIVAVEIVDVHGVGAGRHEGVDLLLLEEHLHRAGEARGRRRGAGPRRAR